MPSPRLHLNNRPIIIRMTAESLVSDPESSDKDINIYGHVFFDVGENI